MSVIHLEQLCRPASVAVIGASNRAGSVGHIVLRNLVAAGFEGPIWAVNPRHDCIEGLPCVPSVEALPAAPDLAVICTPPATLPALIEALGARGTRAVIVITALERDADITPGIRQRCLDAARQHQLRILGPNCVGLLAPGARLNASFAHAAGRPGPLAFVSQSGALCTAVLDWANARGIGFSHFVSLGDALDVDFGDLIDYLGHQHDTRAILLYIEAVMAPRKFLSAARAVARHKPIVLIKAGRNAAGARAAASHTGAITGGDDVFDAAVRRAGILRVDSIDALFEAVESLAHPRARPAGERLLIVTNGGGLGVLAADALAGAGGTLATLEAPLVAELDTLLPRTWSRANPLDIVGDADANRYARALEVIGRSDAWDALLVMLVPTALVDNAAVAHSVAAFAARTRRPLFAVWMGGPAVAAARTVLAGAGIPQFDTPTSAVRAWLQLVTYAHNQAALIETPPSRPARVPDAARARAVIDAALSSGRTALGELDTKTLLTAYGLPVVESVRVTTPEDARRAAARLGYPVVAKLVSPDVSHKSDVGGVQLDLPDADALDAALGRIDANLQRHRPDARHGGYTVQRMAPRAGAYELLLGLTRDPVFGPALVFGAGGTAVEVLRDTAVALPPLNAALARDLIERTRIARLLHGYRDRPGVAFDALIDALLDLSQLVVEHPQLVELDINPLLCDEHGVLALDARATVAGDPGPGLVIRPYPSELVTHVVLPDGTPLTIRPIRPEDEAMHRTFLERIAPEDLHFRFFRATNRLTHEFLAAFTQIDYDREMALIAVREAADGTAETLGVVRAVVDANNAGAEFAILVRSDCKGRGIGRVLMTGIIDYQRARGTGELHGDVLAHNHAMLAHCRALGFVLGDTRDGIVEVTMPLTRHHPGAA
ncbi:MAG: bifunctional acetate--CoA ligase family protein/GNAT family N-acetyltransferase [Gammaproteobacteria bacterium]|nr:bifunctional acetate--CoA ligase family protein/GNAT family N-acetyltransferase [Gammaproteobacteria bacterium]